MSNHFTWQSAVIKSELSANAKLCLMVIGTYMNQHGSGAFPSYNTIASDASLSRRTVINSVAEAVDNGWLIKSVRSSKDGQTSNAYAVSYPKLGSASDALGGAPNTLGVVHSLHGGGASDALGECCSLHPNTPLNTPINTKDKNITHGQANADSDVDKNLNLSVKEKSPAPKKQTSVAKVTIEKPDDVSDEVWKSYCDMRTSRRALTSSVVISRIRSQCEIAGVTLEFALIECITNNWLGFNADWLKNRSIATKESKKFNPTSYVNRNRRQAHDAVIIDI